MTMFNLDTGSIMMILIFSVPIVAIVGGITAGIVSTLGRQRLMELAQQERIAAIQRGVDPAKLPPLPAALDDADGASSLYLPPTERDRRRAQGLLVGGVITTLAGLGLIAFFMILRPDGNDTEARHVWAVGIIPVFVGVALLLSSWLVRPRNGR